MDKIFSSKVSIFAIVYVLLAGFIYQTLRVANGSLLECGIPAPASRDYGTVSCHFPYSELNLLLLLSLIILFIAFVIRRNFFIPILIAVVVFYEFYRIGYIELF